ncbi:zinc finger CCHC domain-containing protein 10-like [Macrobrachium rosenbergii]|uniref:zinc finger CCHC domain-containing protein 10-like n=1 Tax=Macrobrachium rosenbergii TaxID=79674 RepID=UPI0034D585A9
MGNSVDVFGGGDRKGGGSGYGGCQMEGGSEGEVRGGSEVGAGKPQGEWPRGGGGHAVCEKKLETPRDKEQHRSNSKQTKQSERQQLNAGRCQGAKVVKRKRPRARSRSDGEVVVPAEAAFHKRCLLSKEHHWDHPNSPPPSSDYRTSAAAADNKKSSSSSSTNNNNTTATSKAPPTDASSSSSSSPSSSKSKHDDDSLISSQKTIPVAPNIVPLSLEGWSPKRVGLEPQSASLARTTTGFLSAFFSLNHRLQVAQTSGSTIAIPG